MVDLKAVQFYFLSHDAIPSVNRTDFNQKVDFQVVDNLGAFWSEGKLLVKLLNKQREHINGNFRMSAPDYVKRILEQDSSEIDDVSLLNPASSSSPVNPKSSAKPSPFNVKSDGVSKHLLLPAYLDTPADFKLAFNIIFGIIKIIIFLLQIYLVFIRPCMNSTTAHIIGSDKFTNRFGHLNYLSKPAKQEGQIELIMTPLPESRWTAWYASTLLSLQLLLSFGYLTGNFGGFVDGILDLGIKHFNNYFWALNEQMKFPFQTRFNDLTSSFRIPKFDDSGFMPNPIEQFPIELLILLVSIFLNSINNLITDSGSKGEGVIKNLRLGTSLAFMYPLLMASIACIYKIGGIVMFGGLDHFDGAKMKPRTHAQPSMGPSPSSSGSFSNSGHLASKPHEQAANKNNVLDPYCHISFLISGFVTVYYVFWILGTAFKKHETSNKNNTKELEHLNFPASDSTPL